MSFTFGSWNVRTLLDKVNVDRPERHTALVAKDLSRYNVDIAALSEIRFADVGTPSIGVEEAKMSAVNQVLGSPSKTSLSKKLSSLPKGVNDRLMTLYLPLKGKSQAIIMKTLTV